MKFLIVQTGAAPAPVRRRYGDYPQWFRRGLAIAAAQIECVRVDRGGNLPSPRTLAAALVTGSDAMVSERRAWSERTAAWLRDAVDADLPLLGVCYGHQLLAHALGGRVHYNPRGEEIGTIEVRRLAAARADMLFGALPARFPAQATHEQTILQPPRGAAVLAASEQDDHQAVRFAPRAWGVQFHPEFGVREMRAFLAGEQQADKRRCVRACREARGILRRFAQLFMR